MRTLFLAIVASLATSATTALAANLPDLAIPTPVPERVVDHLHYDLSVTLDPAAHRFEAQVDVTVPSAWLKRHDGVIDLVLNDTIELRLLPQSDPVTLEDRPVPAAQAASSSFPLRIYRVRPRTATGRRLQLGFALAGELEAPATSNRPGIPPPDGSISPRGAVLTGASRWLPWTGDALASYRLDVDMPSHWQSVGAGRRSSDEVDGRRRRQTWVAERPLPEVTLLAGPLHEYRRDLDGVPFHIYLRGSDEVTAKRYFEAAENYLTLYSDLIGDYPYEKVALLESSGATGYSLPTITVLGSAVLDGSTIAFGHELLHSWWGNSVFVDPSHGNWSEGLTAYLSDHLLREQSDAGATYRRHLIESYLSIASTSADLPLTRFRAADTPAAAVVGYAKGMMIWHMLRRRIGDDQFRAGLRRAFRRRQFQRTSLPDIAREFTVAADRRAARFLARWASRTGAPELELRVAPSPARGGVGELTIDVRQVQQERPYEVDVPIVVRIDGDREERRRLLRCDRRETRVRLSVPAGVQLEVELDPDFDVLRTLARNDRPATIDDLLEAERTVVVLPRTGDEATDRRWQKWADELPTSGTVERVWDDQIDALPDDVDVWILSAENRWTAALAGVLDDFAIEVVDAESLHLGRSARPLTRTRTAWAVALPHPTADQHRVVLVGAETTAANGLDREALALLSRQMPQAPGRSYLAVRARSQPPVQRSGRWLQPRSPRLWRSGRLLARPPATPEVPLVAAPAGGS